MEFGRKSAPKTGADIQRELYPEPLIVKRLNGEHDVPEDRIAHILETTPDLSGELTAGNMAAQLASSLRRREYLYANETAEETVVRYARDMLVKAEARIFAAANSCLKELTFEYPAFDYDQGIVEDAAEAVAEILKQRGFSVFFAKHHNSHGIADRLHNYMPPYNYQLNIKF